jgi:hypothetical protein
MWVSVAVPHQWARPAQNGWSSRFAVLKRSAWLENRHQHDGTAEVARISEDCRQTTAPAPAVRHKRCSSTRVPRDRGYGRHPLDRHHFRYVCRNWWTRRGVLRLRAASWSRYWHSGRRRGDWSGLGSNLVPPTCRTHQSLDERHQDEEREQEEGFERHDQDSPVIVYRLPWAGSSPPPSAIDSRIDESAWMFFIR